MLQAGIIGCGGISRHHLNGYRQLPDVTVGACCDIDGPKAEAYAKENGIPRWYTDYNEMMAKERLDLVSVTTWNAAHKGAAIAVLKGGADVICEKPMAMNAAEAQEMQRTAEECGRLLQVGFVRRFGNDADVFKSFRDAGTFGDLYYAKAAYIRRSGCPGGWFGDKRYSGGGPLIDLGVHVIDLVRYLAGNPKPVSAYGVTYANLGPHRAEGLGGGWRTNAGGRFEHNVEDMASALIRFESGLTLSVETSFNLNVREDREGIELFGTRGGASLSPELEMYTQMAGKFVNVTPAFSTALSFDGLFEREIKGFVDAAKGEIPCVATAEDGVVLMKILDAVYESARTGREVPIL